MSQKTKLLALLDEFGVTPEQESFTVEGEPFDRVTLVAKQGNVEGYTGFACDFEFDAFGNFKSVGVWEGVWE